MLVAQPLSKLKRSLWCETKAELDIERARNTELENDLKGMQSKRDELGKLLQDEVARNRGKLAGIEHQGNEALRALSAREVEVSHEEFPSDWFAGLPPALYASRKYHVPTNAYKVKSGFGQREWEALEDKKGTAWCAKKAKSAKKLSKLCASGKAKKCEATCGC